MPCGQDIAIPWCGCATKIPRTANVVGAPRLRENCEGCIHSSFHQPFGEFTMKKLLVLAFLAASLSVSSPVRAAATKTYQVTGPVLEVTSEVVVVQKGKEKWEIARTADTKVKGELKVGAKVTIEYRMTATAVEVKEDAKAKK
jgi:hypothetical protein